MSVPAFSYWRYDLVVTRVYLVAAAVGADGDVFAHGRPARLVRVGVELQRVGHGLAEAGLELVLAGGRGRR